MSAPVTDFKESFNGNSPETVNSRKEYIKNHPDANLIRPCATYWRECEACFAAPSRIRQRYVNGKDTDCTPLLNVFEKCNAMERGGEDSLDAMNDLIAYEKQKMDNEKKMMQANNVWEYRSSPPENWSAPLPEFIEARKDTHLNKVGDTWEKQDLRLTVRECLLTGELCCIS